MDGYQNIIGGYNKRLFLNNSRPDFTVPIFINLEDIESKGKRTKKEKNKREATASDGDRETSATLMIIQIEILINLIQSLDLNNIVVAHYSCCI